jgi:hypothetical protein
MDMKTLCLVALGLRPCARRRCFFRVLTQRFKLLIAYVCNTGRLQCHSVCFAQLHVRTLCVISPVACVHLCQGYGYATIRRQGMPSTGPWLTLGVRPAEQVSRTGVDSMVQLLWEHATALVAKADYHGLSPGLASPHMDFIYNIGSKVRQYVFPWCPAAKWLQRHRCVTRSNSACTRLPGAAGPIRCM